VARLCGAPAAGEVDVSVASPSADNERLQAELAACTLELGRVSRDADLLHAILDDGPDATLVADPRGVITRFNPAAERLFGWPRADVVGAHISLLMPLAYPVQTSDPGLGRDAAWFPSGVGVSREASGRRRDGSTFAIMIYGCEVLSGEDRQFVKFVRDLTPVREAEQSVVALQAQLTRASGLHSTGAVAAVLAHELNQPLGAITSYVEGVRALLTRKGVGDEAPRAALEALDGARDQAIRAGEIIRRIRTLVAGDLSGRRAASVRGMILEMDFMVGLLTRDAGVTVLYDVSIADGPVIADSVQIQQVVLNLVRNAVEAMHGSADRRLEISSRLENEVWIVAVEDSGPGLKKETEAGLFIGSSIGQGAGLGMGLSICKTIVEHHGGRIWAGRSRWGGGAFSFSLPRAAHAT